MRRPGGHQTSSGGLDCLTSIQRGQGTGQTRCHLCRRTQYRQLVQTSRQAAWHNKPRKTTSRYAPPAAVRAEEVVLHRLRLGYVTLDELRDGFEERPCEHCLI
ncbi:hypothetical protein GWK47_032636 [Chionoecetes opilio]|uniref:Uncharacterized protein n=1 Tax=Chionoecetes opilio TaxID=41210 RepID=A0A8J4YVY8_CHIOP|nr:hypothetical protein GWK47_032636 [Chionoecetes opilio]